eukprot:scaffold3055_cov402-Prasinococcus_capsulatus_cf.AAC.3
MTIHDYDLVRFLLAEEMRVVSAMGSCLVDRTIAEAGDVDTLMVSMISESGKQCHISNSRVCPYSRQGTPLRPCILSVFLAELSRFSREYHRSLSRVGDYRVQLVGSKGMLDSESLRTLDTCMSEDDPGRIDKPWFWARWADAFDAQWDAFVNAYQGVRSVQTESLCTVDDSFQALRIAQAAATSARTNTFTEL